MLYSVDTIPCVDTGWSALEIEAELLHERAADVRESVLKRVLDIIGAFAGLVLLAPLLLAVAAMVRLESPGPAIFKQRRTGLGGRVFQIYKFRTMTVTEDGDTVVQAQKGDHRVTRLGSFLRHSCIDELPQLWNVLIGDMSFIGPRPHALAHDVYYGKLISGYDRRFLVRPGMAGLAQIKGLRGPTQRTEDMRERVALDLEYIATWNFGLDLWLLLEAVIRGPFHKMAL
ncbi:MAG: sugar transferase [Burkholderiaceae bacterium]|jgi:lipopolysaccharide/colanic/teichoic acid biosynthesis glycosyltransferase|nr:sugar transferase [Burkholderiaceae bacterium]